VTGLSVEKPGHSIRTRHRLIRDRAVGRGSWTDGSVFVAGELTSIRVRRHAPGSGSLARVGKADPRSDPCCRIGPTVTSASRTNPFRVAIREGGVRSGKRNAGRLVVWGESVSSDLKSLFARLSADCEEACWKSGTSLRQDGSGNDTEGLRTMKRLVFLIAAVCVSFLSGWLLSPGRNNIGFETIKTLSLGDSDRKIGILPAGTRLFAEGYIAPDVGFVGCVPVSFGDSLKVNLFMKPVGRLSTSLSRGEEGHHAYLSADTMVGAN
jgi:hypothetical protein